MAKARKTTPRKRELTKERETTRAVKASFDAEHARGMKALKKHDFETVNRAIAREHELIKRQTALISRKRSKPSKPK